MCINNYVQKKVYAILYICAVYTYTNKDSYQLVIATILYENERLSASTLQTAAAHLHKPSYLCAKLYINL